MPPRNVSPPPSRVADADRREADACADFVRLSGQYIRRMHKALELMSLKSTKVLGDITSVTGLRIIRSILAGERGPQALAGLRDRRCKRAEPEIAQALDGRYRHEHVTEL